MARRLNTATRSSAAYWYLRGLDLPGELPTEEKVDPTGLWEWVDTRGETGAVALPPLDIVCGRGLHYYTNTQRPGILTEALALVHPASPAGEIELGKHLTAVFADSRNVYTLDIEQRRIAILEYFPESGHRDPLELPKRLELTADTRFAAWTVSGAHRVLVWQGGQRGYVLLAQELPGTPLKERRADLLLPKDHGAMQLGDALVADGNVLFFTDVRSGSIFRLFLAALERSSAENERADDGRALRIVGCGKKNVIFGPMGESQLIAPTSLAMFSFERNDHQASQLKKCFGDFSQRVLEHRFLVCIDSAAARVVTISLRANEHELLPLLGSGRNTPARHDPDDLLTYPMTYSKVVRGLSGALLFGNPNQRRWRVLRPQLDAFSPGTFDGVKKDSHS